MLIKLLTKVFGSRNDRTLRRMRKAVAVINGMEPAMEKLSDDELKAKTAEFRARLEKGETLESLIPEAFAVVREASKRVFGMRHFDVQLLGGMVLNERCIAEMRTGEGKTLTATLPAYLNALTGKGVHVVTVNDYLAQRDAENNRPLFEFLGMTVGINMSGLPAPAKREAYNADITYGTNNEYGFDYLRDNMAFSPEERVQRKLHYALVDEVDSILIDEARTPLIISGQGDKSTDLYGHADRFAKKLKMIRVAELDEKEDNDELYKEYDYVVNEKLKTASLTPAGVKKAEQFFSIENLTDADNLTIQHHINQAIKANGVMRSDIDYVVKDGEVIIVDEFTGRLMNGRRYNEGLHQAIEAKEGVEVARESKTLATITFQNYFRLYTKLSGMTGTAMTEEEEFREIYKLDVVEIPTNRSLAREDLPDVVYKTEKAKFDAVIEDVEEHYKKGQPVLVGTISIEKSEILSSMLKRRGVKHEVLNAKYHEKEAEIVAQAGKKGAVTIATNMAGRGTDIMLGGNAEYMAKSEMRRMGFSEELISESTAYSDTQDPEILEARKTYVELNDKYKEQIRPIAEEVRSLGGLYIIGTERHESRRIDNQLRGRAGRQGDPGKSRFFISLEDDLMRLFGGERISNLMDSLKVEEDMPIEAGMLSKTIESAQRKVEGRNFGIRKNVLQYDDVMNRQREVIYKQRDQVLDGENIRGQIITMIEQAIDTNIKRYLPEDQLHDDWDFKGLRDHYMGWLIKPEELEFTPEELEDLDPEYVKNELLQIANRMYEQRENEYSPEIVRELERVILLKNVDVLWMDHIDAMEELQRGIRLRAYAQRDPVVEYRMEGFDMFDSMISQIRENTARMMLTVRLQTQEEPKREEVAKPTMATGAGDGSEENHPVVNDKKVGRNDPCPCGSGKKYKKCCGKDE